MKSSKLHQTNPTIRFSAKLSHDLLTLPIKENAKLAGQGAVMVEGTINTFPFRAALESNNKGSHQLKVAKDMQIAIKANDGDLMAVEITRVDDEQETRVPIDLRKALKAIRSAQESWADITPMARRDWIFSICSAKQAETRKRRIDKACDMLASGKRRLCCFPGIKWMMKENAKTCGMWLPLSNQKDSSSAKLKTAKIKEA